jgi:hypothetical protein
VKKYSDGIVWYPSPSTHPTVTKIGFNQFSQIVLHMHIRIELSAVTYDFDDFYFAVMELCA